MKTSNPSYLCINRIDYKNRDSRNGFKMLPPVHSFEEITDVNEIYGITLGHFYSKEERNNIITFFPKSYKPALLSGHDFNEVTRISDYNNPFYSICFNFNTFWSNDVTGAKNESAIARREKVIKKIKEYLKSL